MRVERATPSDVPAVERLLAASGLPLDGAAEALSLGVVAHDGDEVVAAAAIERYGDAWLLRSVVVEPGRRGIGLGQDIVAAAEQLARDDGITELYLLTENAIDWFPRLGYDVIARADAVAAGRRVDRVHDRVQGHRGTDAAVPGVTRARAVCSYAPLAPTGVTAAPVAPARRALASAAGRG